ncbi:MAG: NAD(P)H-hydrate dehydratase [Bacteroidota bacterium]
MKILSAEQTRKADQYTIENEPIPSIELMERASAAFVKWFESEFDPTHCIYVFCGTGNNGGDGLAVARMLIGNGYSVQIFVVGNIEVGSSDFKTNLDRLNSPYQRLDTKRDFPGVESDGVVVDAIFGSGLSREVGGLYAEVIHYLNNLGRVRVSIDIPSGLFADKHSEGVIFRSDYTVSFQLPKLAFMFPENHEYVGNWNVVNIGLSNDFINAVSANTYYSSESEITQKVKRRGKFDHKGVFGKAMLVSGSLGKMGAAILCGKAALRSGLGLLTIYVPQCGYTIIQTALPEAMAIVDQNEEFISKIAVEDYSAIGIGPGIGKNKNTVNALANLLNECKGTTVLDADALNILSENRELIQLLPENSILTPHPKEFSRLVGNSANDFERLEKQKQFSADYDVIVVLKGAHTSITAPDKSVFFNSTGNPGMGTAGSGDVLTGVITALVANGYSSIEAAIIGVYMHGLAGDLASRQKGQTGMIASDIISCLPLAFQKFDK